MEIKMKKIKNIVWILIFSGIFCTVNLNASPKDGIHKIVIQVSSSDPDSQKTALNNAVNVLEVLNGQAQIEIVAYGPGLSILTDKSPHSQRIKDLALRSELKFSACGNTMDKIEKKTGKKVVLTKGVGIVPGGVIRIMELQEAGYTYIRP